jgi:hypothetical protein
LPIAEAWRLVRPDEQDKSSAATEAAADLQVIPQFSIQSGEAAVEAVTTVFTQSVERLRGIEALAQAPAGLTFSAERLSERNLYAEVKRSTENTLVDVVHTAHAVGASLEGDDSVADAARYLRKHLLRIVDVRTGCDRNAATRTAEALRYLHPDAAAADALLDELAAASNVRYGQVGNRHNFVELDAIVAQVFGERPSGRSFMQRIFPQP